MSPQPGRKLRARIARARRAHELAAAAAETIAHRSARMAGALVDPRGRTNTSGLADPEFRRMGAEKLQAGAASARAMALRLAAGQHLWRDFWLLQFRRGSALLPRIAANPSPLDMARLGAESGGLLLADCLGFWAKAAALGEAVADAGARPIHRTATANAHRLAKARLAKSRRGKSSSGKSA